MKIYPRGLDLQNGDTNGTFYIKNTSHSRKFLLYKIRRSEPQLVSFYPKHGIVKPGDVHDIEINLVNAKIPKAKVMVKALIIRSDQIPTDIEMEFDKLWSIAEQCKENSSDGAGSGVQKIIQIRNNSLVKPKYSKGDISGSGESVITDSSLLMSDTPGVDADTSACESSFDQTPVKANISNPKTLTRTYTASTAAMSVHESDEEDEKQTETAGGVAKQEVNENVGNTLPQLKQTHDPIQLASLVSNVVIQTLQSMGISQSNPDMNPNPMGQSLDSSFQKKKHESVAKSQDEHPMRNSWNGMSSKSKSNGKSRSKPTKSKSRNLLELSDSDLEWEDSPPSDTTTKHNKSNPRSLLPTKNKAMDYKLSQQLEELQLKQEAHEKQMNYMNILNQVSSMRHLNAGNGHTRGGVLVEVKGEGVESDAVIHDALEWRVGHVLLEENGDNSMNHDVLSVAIQHCAVNSLVDAIGQLFFVDDDHVSAPSTSSDLKLKRVQYVLSNTHLQHIYINHTTLKALNAQALTRYSQLKTLDLSYNNITSITSGTLDLPFLTTLNLSNNLLKSLDYLQELTSLQVLDASSNKISSLTMSIHMLLPLADCLVKLDVSMNPVATNQRYCEECLDILPNLVSLDGKNLQELMQHNQRKKSHGSPPTNSTNQSFNSISTSRIPSPVVSVKSESDNDLEFENRLKRVLNRMDFQQQKKVAAAASQYNQIGLENSATTRGLLEETSSPSNNSSLISTNTSAMGKSKPWTTKYNSNAKQTSAYYDNRAFNASIQKSVHTKPHAPASGNSNPYANPNTSTISNISTASSNYNNITANHPSNVHGSSSQSQTAPFTPNTSMAQFHPNSSTNSHANAQGAVSSNSASKKAPKGVTGNKKPVPRMSILVVDSPKQKTNQQNSTQPQSALSIDVNSADGSFTGSVRSSTKKAPSPSLLGLTGASKNRRKSFGMVETPSELKAAMAQSMAGDHVSASAAVRTAPGTPKFMKGTSSTRCRRASFDLHCIDEAGGSLSAAKVLHRSYLSENGGSHSGLALGNHNASDINSVADANAVMSMLQNNSRGSNAPEYLDEETFNISQRVFQRGVQAAPMSELNEDERYSIWHPRYRMPINGIFGYSKPFCHRHLKKLKKHPNQFEQHVIQTRESFQKQPLRGTFSRASKGLTAEWYPMDSQDLEAIRRRGYFHETIGDIQKGSYRDLSTQMKMANVTGEDLTNASSILERSGSQILTPNKANRRGSLGMHMSRQYISAENLLEEDHRFREGEDLYSGGRKWDTQAAAGAITASIQKRRLSAASMSPGFSAGTGSGYDNNFSPGANEYDHQPSNNIPFSEYTQSMNGEATERDGYYSDSGVAPRKSSLMNTLFGQLGSAEQPDIAGENRERLASEYASEGQDNHNDTAYHTEEGYTSDPGYSYRNNGSQRLSNLQEHNSAVEYDNKNDAALPDLNSRPTSLISDPKVMSSELQITAESESEKHQIDAYLNWLEKQELHPEETHGSGGREDAAESGFVANNKHVEMGLDHVDEELWERKARIELEEQQES